MAWSLEALQTLHILRDVACLHHPYVEFFVFWVKPYILTYVLPYLLTYLLNYAFVIALVL